MLSEIKYRCFDDGESISDVCVDSVMNQKQTHTNLLHKQQRNLDKKGTKPWLWRDKRNQKPKEYKRTLKI